MIAPTVESNPFTSLGFRLVTKVSLISNFRSSRDLHLFSIAVGASQSAAYDRKKRARLLGRFFLASGMPLVPPLTVSQIGRT
jgi:hypothetical protein